MSQLVPWTVLTQGSVDTRNIERLVDPLTSGDSTQSSALVYATVQMFFGTEARQRRSGIDEMHAADHITLPADQYPSDIASPGEFNRAAAC